MLTEDLVRLALRQIFRNRRRYRGAIIGTTLGIAGLITVMTIGDSVESILGMNLEILGSATIIKAQWHHRSAVSWHQGEYFITDVEDLKKLPGVAQVSPAVWGYPITVAYHRYKKTDVRVGGVEPSLFRAIHLPTASGRRITDDDVTSLRHICIIGENVVRSLFPNGEPPLGKLVVIDGISFEVVGILGGAEDVGYLDTALVPISVARAKLRGMHPIRHIYVRGKNWDIVPELFHSVRDVLKKNQPGFAESMSIECYPERIAAIQRVVALFKFFLYSAIVITLVLGGLGITNIMLALVKERTTEIGLRKAVGATEEAIVLQFLWESLSVSLVGALAGIVMGMVSVEVLGWFLDAEISYKVFLFSVVSAVIIGVLLGVASGVLPAKTAGRLDAVEAMRFE
jgi:putative ABC transport system permease protein